MSKKRTIAALALAGVIATASVFGNSVLAYATSDTAKSEVREKQTQKHVTGKRQFAGVRGVVTSIDTSTLSVEGKNGVTYTVDIGQSVFRNAKTKEASVRADIKSGDTIVVHGVRTGTEVIAKRVIIGPFSGKAFAKHSTATER